MEFREYIKSELLILIPVLYIIGFGLKKSKISDSLIPVLLGAVSVILSTVWVIATSDILTVKNAASAIFTAVTQGVLCAGASVYINQIYRQIEK